MLDKAREKDLTSRAQGGERGAFDALVADALPQVRAVVRRIIGHPEESDDIVQDAMLRAWQSFAGFRGDARFSTWLTTIASRAAVDHLRKAKRWRTEAQVAYANLCAADTIMSGEVIDAFSQPDFAFEVREHIAYCFACVGRSLPADEQAALVLSDVVEMSARDAARVLGTSESVYRHRLSAARQLMTEKYEGLCALVSKTGICHQCKGLRQIAPEARRGGPFPDIGDYASRAAIVREAAFAAGPMRNLHDVFWRRTAEVEDQGIGSTEPDSQCGVDTGV